eukprot:4813785-Ditylum_brightwellii.AAC.1
MSGNKKYQYLEADHLHHMMKEQGIDANDREKSTKEDSFCTAVASESLARKSPTIPQPFIGSEITKSCKSCCLTDSAIAQETTANKSSE